MKKVIKKTFSILGYAFVYILITLGTAFGILFLSPTSQSSEEGGIYIAPQISHIFNNFSTVKALQIDLDADIETPTDKFSLFVKADLDLSGGLENLETEGVITVFANQEYLDINFNYAKGIIYVEVLNGKYRIQTNDIGGSINQILSVLDIEMPELGIDIGNLDPNSILAMLSDLTETKGEDSIKLNINVPVVGSIELVCDLNYSIKELLLPKTTISDGTSIALSSTLEYPEKVEVIKPEDNEYIEATYLFNVAGAALEYINQDQIGFDVELNYNNQNIYGNFSADMKNLSAKFEIDVLDMPFKIIAQDNIFFLEYGNLYLKFALNDTTEIAKLLNNQFELNIPIDSVAAVLTALKDGNLFDIIPNLDFGSSNPKTSSISDIDLSIIQSFDKVENDFILTLRDIGQLTFTLDNNKLSAVKYDGQDINASLKIKEAEKISLATAIDGYVNMADIIPAINAFINTYKLDNYVGNANIINDNQILGTINFIIIKNNSNPKAHIEANVYGESIKIDYTDGAIYLQFKDVKIYTTIDDIDTITTFLQDVFNLTINNFDTTNLINQIKNILNPEINPKFIKSLKQIDNGLTLQLFDNTNISLSYTDTIHGLNLVSNNISANIDILASQAEVSLPVLNKEDYQPVTKVLNIVKSVKQYLENKKFYSTLNLEYQDYNIAGSVNFDENGLSAFAQTTIDGIKVEIKFVKDIIYLEIGELKITSTLSDLNTVSNFVNAEFGIDLNKILTDFIEELKNIQSNNNDFNLQEFISKLNITLENDSLSLGTSDFNLKFNFVDDKLSSANIETKDFKLNVLINSIPSTIETNGEYFNITQLLPFVNIIKNYVASKQYDISATAQVYEKKELTHTANVTLQADISNKFQFYTKAILNGKMNMDLEASIYQDYLYLGYNGLLLKMNTNDVNELLVLIMNMFGVDPSILPFLKDVANGMDFDFNNLSGFDTGISINNPLSIIGLFKSITINGNTLEFILDGSKISSNERAENMPITLVTDGTTLVSLQIKNLYTGVSNDEHFDLNINFNRFTTVSTPDITKNYVDISGANEIIKAGINMSEYKDFELVGNLNIDMSIPVLSDMHLVVPVTIKLKLVDGKPEVFISIEKIPVVHPLVYNLNNDTNWKYNKVNTLNIATMKSSGETRNLYIYYKDNNVYFYRHELNTDKATYEKKLKAPLETVLSDILYYVQWGTGFNDQVIDAIRESLAKEHDINLGNIIRSFSVTENGCTIVLNMTEISGDSNMGDMTINLGLANHTANINGEQVTKKIIGNIGFKMNMPFTDSLQLNMQTSPDAPLSLVNLGQTIDFTDFYNFVNNYEYEDNIEMEAYNGAWIKAAERQFVVEFVTNQDFTLPSITGTQGTTFDLPSYSIHEISNENEKDVYSFAGWYTSSNFEEGTMYTNGVIPNNNITLYAKWEVIESLRTVEFYVNNIKIDSQFAPVGQTLKEVNFEKEYYEDKDNQRFTMSFVGWVDEDGFTITYIPSDSEKLYAKFEVKDIVTKYTLSFDTGVGQKKESVGIYNSYNCSQVLSDYNTENVVINSNGISTTYQFKGWYIDESYVTPFDNIMPENDLTIFAKWEIINVEHERVFKIIDGNNEIYSVRMKPNANITIPNFIKNDSETQWYLDSNFTLMTTLPNVMPDEDVTLYIRNKYTLTVTYFENINGIHTEKTIQTRLYQGENISLPVQSAYEFDTYIDGHLDKRMYYSFDGYLSEGEKYNLSIMQNYDLSLISNVIESYKNYYTVTFDTREYRASGMWAGSYSWESVSFTPEIEYVLEGNTINLAQDKYQPTRYGKDTWAASKKLYKATSWGENAWGAGTEGGSGFTTYTVTKNVTLYACWQKQ